MEIVACNKTFAERGREMVVMPRKEETKALFMDFYECNFTTERLYKYIYKMFTYEPYYINNIKKKTETTFLRQMAYYFIF